MSEHIKEAIRCHEDWCAHGDCCNKHEVICPVPKALEEFADLERQLKEAKDDKDKCQEYGMSLQQQLQEANERIEEYKKWHSQDKQILADSWKENERLESELTQLRQENDTLRAKLEKMTANCEKIAKHNGEYVAKNNDLRTEVERLKRVNDEYGVEEVGKLVDRVQELEGALNAVIDYAPFGKEDYNIAKRALDGGSK